MILIVNWTLSNDNAVVCIPEGDCNIEASDSSHIVIDTHFSCIWTHLMIIPCSSYNSVLVIFCLICHLDFHQDQVHSIGRAD